MNTINTYDELEKARKDKEKNIEQIKMKLKLPKASDNQVKPKIY